MVKKTDYIFLSILFLITVSAPLGLFLRIDPLRKLGLASLSSPLLIVYSEVSGKKLMSFNYKIEITFEDNSKKNINLDKHKYLELSKKENFFNRHIIIIPYMAASFILYGDEHNTKLRKSILKYGLCNQGSYSKYLELEKDVKKAKFSILDKRNTKKNTEKDTAKNTVVNEFMLNCREEWVKISLIQLNLMLSNSA